MDSPSGPHHLQRTNSNLRAISEILKSHNLIEEPLCRRSNYGDAIARGLQHGLVKELKPYIAWALDHSHRYHFAAAAGIEYQLVKEAVKHPELADIMAPRLRKAMSHFLERERRAFAHRVELTSEFTGPALAAKGNKSMEAIINPMVPNTLSKYRKSAMIMAHAQLALGWYGQDADFSRVPGMRQFALTCGANATQSVRADFIRRHALSEPVINLLNALRHSRHPANRSLKAELKNIRACMISVNTRFAQEKTIPVIMDFNTPGQPAIYCNTSRSPASDVLQGTGTPFDSKEWDIAPPLLYKIHEALEEIMHVGPASISQDAALAQQQIRYLISQNRSIFAEMPDAFKARYGSVPVFQDPAFAFQRA